MTESSHPMASTTTGVQLFSQSFFSPPVDSARLVAACPTIDLTAASGDGGVVYVRRRGGEVVSKLAERNKQVQAVAWKADGQYLAVAWSDGVVRLAGLESPKALHQIRLFEGDTKPSTITFISWVKNLVGVPESWHTSLLENLGDGDRKEMQDLPRTLMFLEIEDDLPKLPPLPVSGGSGDDMFVFSTRTSLEFIFPALKPSEGDAIHLMVLGTDDGAIHVCIYDTFVMGTFKVPLPLSPAGTATEEPQPLLQLRRHANHPASSTHSLLLANDSADKNAVYLLPVDFSFIFSSPLNLSLLDYKTTTFQKLFRYIRQTQVHMAGEWQAARELPARFLASIQEDLQQEPRYKTIDHALRVAALAGYVPPTLKQWLVDTIAERGHKRWDKAVVSGLENLRDLLHENMMPVLDRATLALDRLHGLAAFHSGEDDIGFTPEQIMQLMDMLSCLILVSHNALALVTAELELFGAFSSWLRLLIERLALPSQAEEQAEKEPILSVTPVLDYISNHLLTSPLDLHFGKVAPADWEADWKALEDSLQSGGGTQTRLMDKLEVELTKIDNIGTGGGERGRIPLMPQKKNRPSRGPVGQGQGQGQGKGKQPEGSLGPPEGQKEEETYMKAFPTFEFLTKLFTTHADRTLKEIAQSAQRHTHLGPLTRLGVGAPVQCAEVATQALLKADLEESADALTFTALTCAEQPRNLYLFRTAIATSNGVTTTVSTQARALTLAAEGSIVDIRFLGADLILVLWTWDNKERPPRLVAIPVQSSRIGYEEYRQDNTAMQAVQIDHDTLVEGGSRGGGNLAAGGLCWVADLGMPAGESSPNGRIVRMEVLPPWDGGSGSGVPARVSLLYADGATYRVFGLPAMADMF